MCRTRHMSSSAPSSRVADPACLARFCLAGREVGGGCQLEFFAEIDLLCALSTCPGGDLSLPMWGPDAQDPLTVCRPLGVEIYRLEDELLGGWSQPERAAYEGQHGLHIAKAEWE